MVGCVWVCVFYHHHSPAFFIGKYSYKVKEKGMKMFAPHQVIFLLCFKLFFDKLRCVYIEKQGVSHGFIK